MKRIIALLLCLTTLLLFGCGGQQPEETPGKTEQTNQGQNDGPLCDGKTLKLLAITSSFGLNTTQFLYDIAVAEGATDVVVGRLYASGCTLEQHVSNANTNANAYQYTKNYSGEWVTMEGIPMLYGLQDEEWDIIFVQQSAHQAGQIGSYKDYIDQLMPFIQENKTNPNARFVWNMTWAFQQDTDQTVFSTVFKGDQMYMYNTIVDVTKEKILPRTDFEVIIPTGTAVQNARTSYFGDTLTKDTYHLNNLGRAIAGYTVWSSLTGKELTEVNLGPINSYDLPQMLELTDADRQVIIECVNAAVAEPFTVTPSTHTEG